MSCLDSNPKTGTMTVSIGISPGLWSILLGVLRLATRMTRMVGFHGFFNTNLTNGRMGRIILEGHTQSTVRETAGTMTVSIGISPGLWSILLGVLRLATRMALMVGFHGFLYE